MDHILENKFLNKEGAYKTAYNELETQLKAMEEGGAEEGGESNQIMEY